jgi:aerobic carbon-monoxide dehydrogenase small subunit
MSDSPHDPAKCEISFSVNGTPLTVHTFPMARLLDVLRSDLQLTGTKEGCGEGECGSCSVLLDGVLVNSCLIPVLQAQDAVIVTIEGLAADQRSKFLQQAFLACGAAQCGICTPGMLLAAHHLLAKHQHPSLDEIREGLAGNLCRCTGYIQIFEAVREASRYKAPDTPIHVPQNAASGVPT